MSPPAHDSDLAYVLSNAVFSGCAGLIITETVKRTGNVGIPAYYAAATCAVSVFALATLRTENSLPSVQRIRTEKGS